MNLIMNYSKFFDLMYLNPAIWTDEKGISGVSLISANIVRIEFQDLVCLSLFKLEYASCLKVSLH
jgi:hypothetical protein